MPSKKDRVVTLSNKQKEREKHSKTPHGNYHNYYFHRAQSIPDVRLKELAPLGLFRNRVVLDLGCNEGKLTSEVVSHLEAKHALGVDLDEVLIARAKELYSSPHVSFSALDFMDIPDPTRLFDYLAQKSPGMPPIDAVLLLSITKWLHLHSGDAGLVRLFSQLHDALPPGGILVVEPQEWENYKSATKKIPALRPTYASLKLRPPFRESLEAQGFVLTHFIERSEGGFSRPLMVLEKK